ncbi:MAG TPA: M24 family metallopeptidase [Acidimicrobiales bacterium]|jgi:Xaa-Pro aminopeptidase
MSSLRAARQERVFDAMDAAGLDVLVLGRRDSIAYATGHQSLWTAGTRPFGAACVLVGATGRSTHLLSTWDAGVPPEIPFDHLYGVTWNPAVMGAALRGIPGLPEARRIGVDALSPGFARAAARLAPDAELVPADDVLRDVRTVKLPVELEGIRAATAIAGLGFAAAVETLEQGSGPANALAAAHRAMASRGATVPSSAPLVRRVGSLMQLDFGVLLGGYEGGLGRTTHLGLAGGKAVPSQDDPADPSVEAQKHLLAACRPGATGRVLRAAVRPPSRWMVRGSGVGFEPPVITHTVGADAVIENGMVLSVEVEVDGWHRRDLVHIGEPL